MQNSASDGVPFEGGAPFAPENESSPSAPPPAYSSYDEVFPALSQPTFSAPVHRNVYNNNHLRVGSSVVTQIFHISRDERKVDNSERFGESESMKACTSIMIATGTKIEICAGKDQALTFLVTGKGSDVQDAKRRIISSFQTSASATVEIPKDYHRKLVGKGGQRMKDLEKSTDCKINVPPVKEDSNTITITGPRDGVEKALHEIKVMYDELSKQAYERVEVPKIYHPFICGAHNENLNKLTAETNVRIHVPPPSAKRDEIAIAGEKEGVELAKSRILEIYEIMEKQCTSVSIEVPKSQHKYIVGPKGHTIQEILQETGVSVEMPAANESVDTITLRGIHENLGKALTMVYQKGRSVKTATVNAPGWLHKRLRGKKGANIRALTQEPTLHIEFKEDQHQIRLEGPPGEVDRVQAALEKEAAEYTSTLVYEELTVDARFFKHIIGKGGANVNRLKDECGVEIVIPEDPGASLLRIEGTKDGVAKAKAELQGMVGKLENEKEKDVIIEHRFYPSIIGSKGERIREIKDMFNQVQINFPPVGDVVKVRGPKEDVEKCAKHLIKLVKELQEESFRMEVPIYKKFHKNIIGKGGANIKKIREETGTKIDLPGEGDESDVIYITGKEDNVRKAMELIQKIQTEMANIVTHELTIPPKFYNALIGAGGKLILAISKECGGVQIKFPPAESKSDKVIVRGPKEDVERAVQLLEEQKNEREAASFSATVQAKPHTHKFLIGKNGNIINKIREDTGARIIFPYKKDDDIITIEGREDQVERAKKVLEQLIADATEEEITVDPLYHKHFVARRGAVVQDITDECDGVTISFPRPSALPGSDKVQLRGSKESVEKAKQRIYEIVEDLKNMVTIECIIPQHHHGTVMGPRGRKVQKITSDYKVQIKFPEREKPRSEDGSPDIPAINGDDEAKNSDVIRITGRAEDCELAREAMLANVPITIEVDVPYEMHRTIIGKAGERVKQLMGEFDVRINVPPAEPVKNSIQITGTPADTENAREAILRIVEEQEKQKEDRALKSYEVTVEVDPEYHPKIIGRRGINISKIREQFDVIINLPKRGSPDEHIVTIIGYEDKANAAKDAILSIVDGLKAMYREEIQIDSRVHSRLIGARRWAIRKVQEEFNVEIQFPRTNPDLVVITGENEDSVADAKERILQQAEEYLQDLEDLPPSQVASQGGLGGPGGPEGFYVRGGPWETGPQQTPDTASITDFPSFGTAAQGPPLASWGPRR